MSKKNQSNEWDEILNAIRNSDDAWCKKMDLFFTQTGFLTQKQVDIVNKILKTDFKIPARYKQFKVQRIIYVNCKKCKQEFPETEIKEATDIAENLFGEDILSFKCPKCNEHTESRRYG